jgi:transcription antitermination factor NusG
MRHWFVINTKPRGESRVESILGQAGFVVYNPRLLRNKKIRPLFPGYEFVVFDYPDQYRLVRYARGVKSVLGVREEPVPVPDELIREIRSREKDGLVVLGELDAGAPEVGDEIEVIDGPLKGLRGIFQRNLGDRDRVAILLSYVSYQAQLKVARSQLRKI